LLGNALAPSAMLHRVAAVLYGMVQHGGTYEAPRLLFPTPDNVSGPPHDLAFTRRGRTARRGLLKTPTSVASGGALSSLPTTAPPSVRGGPGRSLQAAKAPTQPAAVGPCWSQGAVSPSAAEGGEHLQHVVAALLEQREQRQGRRPPGRCPTPTRPRPATSPRRRVRPGRRRPGTGTSRPGATPPISGPLSHPPHHLPKSAPRKRPVCAFSYTRSR
jgi:hypothetical protein